jgi:hypothetical protein
MGTFEYLSRKAPPSLPLSDPSSLWRRKLMSVAAPFFESGEIWLDLCVFTSTLDDLFDALKARMPIDDLIQQVDPKSNVWSKFGDACRIRFALATIPTHRNGTNILDVPPETKLRDLCWAQSEELSLQVKPMTQDGNVLVLTPLQEYIIVYKET